MPTGHPLPPLAGAGNSDQGWTAADGVPVPASDAGPDLPSRAGCQLPWRSYGVYHVVWETKEPPSRVSRPDPPQSRHRLGGVTEMFPPLAQTAAALERGHERTRTPRVCDILPPRTPSGPTTRDGQTPGEGRSTGDLIPVLPEGLSHEKLSGARGASGAMATGRSWGSGWPSGAGRGRSWETGGHGLQHSVVPMPVSQWGPWLCTQRKVGGALL